jgi:propionyl-CoA carboxylase alpha chain
MNDIIAVAALMHLRYVYRGSRISGQMPSYGKRIPMEWMAVVNGEFYPVTVTPPRQDSSEEGFDLHINDHSIVIRSTWQIGDPVLDCTINAKPRAFTVERNGLGYRLHHLGAEIDVRVYRGDVAELARMMPKRKAPDLSKFLMSPMPGQLRSLAVSEGEKVNAGDELAIVEAMKMENALKAGQAAVIGKVHAKPGDVLSVGQVILEFE